VAFFQSGKLFQGKRVYFAKSRKLTLSFLQPLLLLRTNERNPLNDGVAVFINWRPEFSPFVRGSSGGQGN
jgi:hypothetical protein